MLFLFKAWQLSVISILIARVFDTAWFWCLMVVVIHHLNWSFGVISCLLSLANIIWPPLSSFLENFPETTSKLSVFNRSICQLDTVLQQWRAWQIQGESHPSMCALLQIFGWDSVTTEMNTQESFLSVCSHEPTYTHIIAHTPSPLEQSP